MKLGITLPHYDYSLDQSRPIQFEDVAQAATIAEISGFDRAYVSDHVTLDIAKYGGSDAPYRSLDPLSLLGALAPITTTITLGTLVLCEALRHPVMTAAISQTLADISQGRFLLGMGAGWYDPDYEIYGQDMPGIGERMTRLSESLHIMTSLFNGDSLDFDGTFYSTRGATLSSVHIPASHMPHTLPVFVGGKGDRLLRIVAQYADGWNTCWAWTPETYRERVESLHRACEKYDRDPVTVHQSLGLYCVIAESETELKGLFQRLVELSPDGVAERKTLDAWREGHLVGTIDEVAHQLSEWSALGVREVIVNPGFAPFHVGSPEIIEQIGTCLSQAVTMADI